MKSLNDDSLPLVKKLQAACTRLFEPTARDVSVDLCYAERSRCPQSPPERVRESETARPINVREKFKIAFTCRRQLGTMLLDDATELEPVASDQWVTCSGWIGKASSKLH